MDEREAETVLEALFFFFSTAQVMMWRRLLNVSLNKM